MNSFAFTKTRIEIMKSLLKTLVVSLLASGAISASAENLLEGALSAENGWHFWIEKPAIDAGGTAVFQDGKVVVKSPVVEIQAPTNVQLIRELYVDAGKSYKLKFTANAEKAGKLLVSYLLSKSPYTSYASADIDLTPGEKSYECVLAVKMDKMKYESPRSLRLFFGAFKEATVSVSDVSLEEVK